MRFVKPLDVELVKQLASTHDAIITLEEGVVHGGIGQEILAVVQKFNETLDSSKTKSEVIVKGLLITSYLKAQEMSYYMTKLLIMRVLKISTDYSQRRIVFKENSS